MMWDVPLLRKLPRGNGLGPSEILQPKRKEILAIARRHKVTRLRVFGSVARSAAREGSDVDLLVEFLPEATALDQVGLILDLEKLLGRRVDAVEESALHWYVRPQALLEAIPL